MIVAGIGCRKDCGADEIVRLVEKALAQASAPRAALTALAAPAFKADATAPRDAATALGLPLLLIDDADLKSAEPCTVTKSATALKATGVASVAESAALAAVGDGATLLLPRITGRGVTCALAQGAAP